MASKLYGKYPDLPQPPSFLAVDMGGGQPVTVVAGYHGRGGQIRPVPGHRHIFTTDGPRADTHAEENEVTGLGYAVEGIIPNRSYLLQGMPFSELRVIENPDETTGNTYYRVGQANFAFREDAEDFLTELQGTDAEFQRARETGMDIHFGWVGGVPHGSNRPFSVTYRGEAHSFNGTSECRNFLYDLQNRARLSSNRVGNLLSRQLDELIINRVVQDLETILLTDTGEGGGLRELLDGAEAETDNMITEMEEEDGQG